VPVPCPTGSFSTTGSGNHPCRQCPAVHYTDTVGQNACRPCSCPENTYVITACLSTHNHICSAPAPGVLCDDGAQSVAQCKCASGYHRPPSLSLLLAATSAREVTGDRGDVTSLTSLECKRCITSCPQGFYLEGECTQTTTPTCKQCRPDNSCKDTQFLSGSCTATADRVCKELTVCKAGEYIAQRHTRVADRQCLPCITECGAGQYILGMCRAANNPSNAECRDCTTACGTNQFLAGSCGGSVDLTGLAGRYLHLPSGQYASVAVVAAGKDDGNRISVAFENGRTTADGRITNGDINRGVVTFRDDASYTFAYSPDTGVLAWCKGAVPCTVTAVTRWVKVQSKTHCVACRHCVAGRQYESRACDATQDRECTDCASSCPTGEYLTGACGATSGPTCTTCPTTADCGSGEYLTASPCGGRSFPTCAACHGDCEACSGAGPRACTACAADLHLACSSAGCSCVSSCGIGFWGSKETRTCERCDPTCRDCFGAGPGSCLRCSVGGQFERSGDLALGAIRVWGSERDGTESCPTGTEDDLLLQYTFAECSTKVTDHSGNVSMARGP